MRILTTSMMVLALSVTALSGALAQAPAKDKAPPIYGSQLMTQQERTDYRNRMRQAKTAEERERVRQEHHSQMQARAQERGVTLPDEPPARPRGGMGKGPGPAGGPGGAGPMGPGAGRGPAAPGPGTNPQ
ncbi:hypothetical protein [Azospirillum sp.]|uniref:hypothetical protein n=1 Tax=Azospirillum sp. TaxID=34012 RepID=UPI003D745FE4